MRRTITVILVFTLGVVVVHAHHGSAPFNTDVEVSYVGTVTEFDYRNPHSFVHLRTTDAQGNPIDMLIEAVGSSVRPYGVTRESLQPGDRVIATVNPSYSEPSTWGLGVEATKEDGLVVPLSVRFARAMGERSMGMAFNLAGLWVPRGEGFFQAVFGSREPAFDAVLTERGRQARAGFTIEQHSQAHCVAVPPPLLMLYGSIDEIEILEDRVLIHSDWMDAERVIYTDGRAMPDSSEPTVNGYSVGRWNGDVLVVETAHFTENNSGYTSGVATGLEKNLAERFELTEDRSGLTYSFTLEDPEYLAEPVVGQTRWDFRPDLTPDDTPCDLESAGRYLTE